MNCNESWTQKLETLRSGIFTKTRFWWHPKEASENIKLRPHFFSVLDISTFAVKWPKFYLIKKT